MAVEIRNTIDEDIKKLAKIHTRTYELARPEKNWNVKKSTDFISWYFQLNSNLVFTAVKDKKIVGGIIGMVEPNYDDSVLVIKDMFVDPDVQNQAIGSKLLYRLIEKAEALYQVERVIGVTYENEKGYPFKWYEKLGFTKDEDFLISRSVRNLTEKIYESRNQKFYKLLNQYLNILQQGQTVHAVFTMHKDEFDDSPYEVEYVNNNIKAAKRNVRIERIIVVPEEEKEAALTHPAIQKQMKEKNIHFFYVSAEKVLDTSARLYSFINDGFAIFDDLALFVDMREFKEMTGVYTFEKKDIARNEKIFKRLRAISEKIEK